MTADIRPDFPLVGRDAKGRARFRKQCASCGAPSVVRREHLHKLCRSCGRAEGRGFPPGTLIDDDLQHLTKWSWSLNSSGYITHASLGELHRVVLGCVRGDGKEVHHKNHNKLDCRRENLTFVTHSENLQASWKHRKNSSM